MKKLLLILFLLPAISFSQTRREIYISTYKDIAIREMRQYGIPASITLAQGILESGDGQSTLAVKANNHFGIKCHDWTGPKVYHDDDKKGECFRKYKDPEQSFIDHSIFLSTRSRYAELFTLEKTDYKGWANGLKKAGYATSSTYASTLIKLIEVNNLQRFDLEALGDFLLPEQRILEKRNGAKYIVVEEGETIESLAKLYKKSVQKLLDYNDLTHESNIETGQDLYVKKKKCKGATKYYKVKTGDTMYSISQQEGIRLKYLYKRNKKPVGWQPKVGDSLRLKGNVKG